jgi:hypothetical protein
MVLVDGCDRRGGSVRQNHNIGDPRESELIKNDFDASVPSSGVCGKVNFPFGAIADFRSYQIRQFFRLGFGRVKVATSVPRYRNPYGVLAQRRVATLSFTLRLRHAPGTL